MLQQLFNKTGDDYITPRQSFGGPSFSWEHRQRVVRSWKGSDFTVAAVVPKATPGVEGLHAKEERRESRSSFTALSHLLGLKSWSSISCLLLHSEMGHHILNDVGVGSAGHVRAETQTAPITAGVYGTLNQRKTANLRPETWADQEANTPNSRPGNARRTASARHKE